MLIIGTFFQSKRCKCVSVSGSSCGSLWWDSQAPSCELYTPRPLLTWKWLREGF